MFFLIFFPIKIMYKQHNYVTKYFIIPVHMTSMPGRSFEPMVFKYSEDDTVGTALEAQYSESMFKS